MYKHLLIATDGSELAQKAVTQGLALARALAGKVTVVTVTEPLYAMFSGDMPYTPPMEDYEKSIAESAAAILTSVTAQAQAQGQPCEVLHVRDRYPADGIVESANKLGCDLIVMASHGRRGISRMLLGSQANQVVVHSPIPVLICR